MFGALIRIGRDPAMAPSEARYVVLTNIVTMLGVMFTVGFAPVLLVSGSLTYPVAGVIGKRKFIYDLWGDTVNIASRMESHGLPGTVHLSESSRRLLDGKFRVKHRGAIEVKGKGQMETWFLEGPVPEDVPVASAAS